MWAVSVPLPVVLPVPFQTDKAEALGKRMNISMTATPTLSDMPSIDLVCLLVAAVPMAKITAAFICSLGLATQHTLSRFAVQQADGCDCGIHLPTF